jgi:hypothetical protein
MIEPRITVYDMISVCSVQFSADYLFTKSFVNFAPTTMYLTNKVVMGPDCCRPEHTYVPYNTIAEHP